MELRRAARLISQLGSALSAAHAVGVIHRDLNPGNVMLQTFGDGDEFAVLIDFGLATVGDLEAGRCAHQTKAAGTFPYMAPEQLRSDPIPASDVWALGVVAYEMATGRVPFPARDTLALDDMQQAGVTVEPRALRPELPEAAQAVILKALSYDPTTRYAQAREMGAAFLRAVWGSADAGLPQTVTAPHYPRALGGRTAPPTPPPTEELLRRCRELFEEFDEFHSPDTLRPLFRTGELSVYEPCVRRSAGLDFNQLLDCLFRSGREYRGQALLDLLALLAARYRKDYRGQACEGLRSDLRWQFA
jgi:serine/threonine protein kinase